MRGPGGRGEADVIVNGSVEKVTEAEAGRERKAEATGSRKPAPTSLPSQKPPRHPGLSPLPKLKDLQSQLAKAQQDLGQLAVGEVGVEGKLEDLKEYLATLHAQLEVMYKRQLKGGSTPQVSWAWGWGLCPCRDSAYADLCRVYGSDCGEFWGYDEGSCGPHPPPCAGLLPPHPVLPLAAAGVRPSVQALAHESGYQREGAGQIPPCQTEPRVGKGGGGGAKVEGRIIIGVFPHKASLHFVTSL